MDDIGQASNDCRNASLMPGLTAVFAVGFTLKLCVRFWAGGFLQSRHSTGGGCWSYVESRDCRSSAMIAAQAPVHFELPQIRSLKVGGRPAGVRTKGRKWGVLTFQTCIR